MIRRSLRSWLWRIPVEQEVDEEIALHLELRTRELIDRGVDPKMAHAQAVKRMGDLRNVKRELVGLSRKRDREMKITQWMEEFKVDVKFAFRQLRSAPVFTLIAVTTLALGIGANSAIFALVDATLLRPLPFREPERLVAIHETTAKAARSFVSPLNMTDWAARGKTFEKIAGFTPNVGGMVMAGADGNAETVSRQWVSAEIFDVLGVKAIAGRVFLASDDVQRAKVVVMSESFWRSRFNSDPKVVGREIRLDGDMWTVVGVVPEDFQLVGRSSIWAMRPITGAPPRARGAYVLSAVGRMKPGVSIDAARADLATVASSLAREFPQTNAGRGIAMESMHDSIVGGDLRLTSMVFLGVVGFVLLICCANVANLLLARATSRTRELAVRSALGAGRRRIVRQLMTESMVLSILGGALGIGLGALIINAAPSFLPQGLLPAAVTIEFDLRVVGFCAGAAVLVGLLFGIAPAWQATGFSPQETMGADARTTAGGGGRIRGLLVMGEVATAVLLLFGAGLLLRTLIAVQSFDRGYRAESVLTMLVDPLGSKYPTPESLQQFLDQVEGEVRAVPGVQDAAWTSALPLGFVDEGGFSYEIVGDPPVEDSQRPGTEYQTVSRTYFSTLDLPIVAGRPFDQRDTHASVPVAIVNEAFANSLNGRSPIGLQVALRPSSSPEAAPVIREIVGVARQIKGRPDEPKDFIQVYAPSEQDLSDDIFLVVRPKSGRAEALVSSVRAAISRIDKEQLVSIRDIMTLADIDSAATGRHRFRALMVGAFAALSLLLAMVGVFGILAYSVQQRVRDLGVRRALGATTRDIVRDVVSNAARMIGAGAVAGLILAAMLSRLITSILFGVQPLDFVSFAAVTLVVVIAGALSVVGPAWRAANVDPAEALRTK
ncbi:MAG: ABC transporter permease [Vicinamibacteria bacterium]